MRAEIVECELYVAVFQHKPLYLRGVFPMHHIKRAQKQYIIVVFRGVLPRVVGDFAVIEAGVLPYVAGNIYLPLYAAVIVLKLTVLSVRTLAEGFFEPFYKHNEKQIIPYIVCFAYGVIKHLAIVGKSVFNQIAKKIRFVVCVKS